MVSRCASKRWIEVCSQDSSIVRLLSQKSPSSSNRLRITCQTCPHTARCSSNNPSSTNFLSCDDLRRVNAADADVQRLGETVHNLAAVSLLQISSSFLMMLRSEAVRFWHRLKMTLTRQRSVSPLETGRASEPLTSQGLLGFCMIVREWNKWQHNCARRIGGHCVSGCENLPCLVCFAYCDITSFLFTSGLL